MKKTITALAVISLIAGVAFAAEVTSANIVGYVTDTTPVGFHIAAMQFDDGTNTVASVYGGSLDVGTQIYAWNGSGYDVTTYASQFVPFVGNVIGWSDENVSLDLGQGHWVSSAGIQAPILAGEVASGPVTNSLSTGYNLCSFPYPVDVSITNMDVTPSIGDQVFIYTGSGYDVSTYASQFVPFVGNVVGWSDDTLTVPAGQGFWYNSVDGKSWVADFTPVQN